VVFGHPSVEKHERRTTQQVRIYIKMLLTFKLNNGQWSSIPHVGIWNYPCQ
jgi:hypothetical protein